MIEIKGVETAGGIEFESDSGSRGEIIITIFVSVL